MTHAVVVYHNDIHVHAVVHVVYHSMMTHVQLVFYKYCNDGHDYTMTIVYVPAELPY